MAKDPARTPYAPMKSLVRNKVLWLVLVLVVAVLVIRAMLPIWVRDHVNRKLNEIEDYSGQVADVDIHLWRGAYSAHGVEIKKTGGGVPVPFFSAPTVDLSVEWKALFEGALVGEIHFEQPKINLVNGRSAATTQIGVNRPWTDKIRELFPLKINRFTVSGGEAHYRDYGRTPKVDVEMDQVRMVATNLTNSRELSETLVAEVDVAGRPLRSGQLRANLDMDPYAAKPTFSLELEADGIPLVELNDFAKAYTNITFEKGMLRVATSLSSKQGRFTGYFEPVFDEMVIFDPSEDNANPIDFIWEGIVAGLTRGIRNHPKDRFGTKVPISGSFDDPTPAVLETVFNVFRNAFVKAFEGKLSNDDIDLENIPKSGESPKDG